LLALMGQRVGVRNPDRFTIRKRYYWFERIDVKGPEGLVGYMTEMWRESCPARPRSPTHCRLLLSKTDLKLIAYQDCSYAPRHLPATSGWLIFK
jgi:hypothetical protein